MGPSTQLFGVLGREVVHGRGKAGDEVAPDGCAGEGVEAREKEVDVDVGFDGAVDDGGEVGG